MKLKKIFISIYISVLILFVISLIVLSILGNKERVGYLGNLTFVSSESSQHNYNYSFKINYYDKVFRNSDVYGVYLNTNSLPNYVKEIKMNDKFGTPFGTLVSSERLKEDKIDNIKYFLKLRLSNLFIYLILFNIFFILLYIFRKFVFNIFHYILLVLKKNKKLLLIYFIIYILLIVSLFILGRIEREGYLSDISINADDTLKINNINIETTKKLFYSNDKLNYSSLTNYIFTNNNISKYSYNFRIRYYSKVFRNSDIYGVYLNTNSLPGYVKEIKMNDKFGTPFGTLVSSERLKEDKIDNIYYKLKLKFAFLSILFLSFILLIIFIYELRNIILKFLNFLLYKIININRYVYILFIFLCFLIMPNIIYKVFYDKFDHINYENRLKTDKPILSINTLSNYPSMYENYFNDYVPFRNELVKLKNCIDVFLFNNFMSSDFLFAEDKWVFSKYVISNNRNFFSTEELKQAAYNLLHFRDELKKRNIDFIFMVCPNPANIMTNKYPKYIKPIEYNSTDQFISYISENTDLKIVYPKKELLEYKDNYQLYYKYDHHWNNIGAYVGFKILSDKLFMNLEKLSDLNILSFDVSYRKYWVFNNNYDFYNTSVRTMNLHNLKYFRDDPIYYIEKYHIKTNYYLLEGRKHYHFPSVTRSTVAFNDYNVFFIDDSYAYGMFDYIATEFYKASFRHFVEFKIEEIIKYNPNIIVFVIVEGNLKKTVLDIIPNYKIEEINKDLETNRIVTNN